MASLWFPAACNFPAWCSGIVNSQPTVCYVNQLVCWPPPCLLRRPTCGGSTPTRSRYSRCCCKHTRSSCSQSGLITTATCGPQVRCGMCKTCVSLALRVFRSLWCSRLYWVGSVRTVGAGVLTAASLPPRYAAMVLQSCGTATRSKCSSQRRRAMRQRRQRQVRRRRKARQQRAAAAASQQQPASQPSLEPSSWGEARPANPLEAAAAAAARAAAAPAARKQAAARALAAPAVG